MAAFRDSLGREWTVVINTTVLRRCRDLVGHNPLDIIDDGEKGAAFQKDFVAMIDTLYAIVQPDAQQRGVSDVSFGESLVGDALMHGIDAMREAAISFCPSPQARKALRAMVELGQLRAQRVADVVESHLRDERTRVSESGPGGSASTSEEHAASTQVPGLSETSSN